MSRPARPSHGLVCMAALDVRRRPAHASELKSQLLMGEVVRLVRRAAGGRWWRVESRTDGYRGWARAWGLVGVSARAAARWERRARARVIRPWATVRERPGRGPVVSPMPFGARVIAGGTRGRYRRVVLPDGREGWTERERLTARAQSPRPLAACVADLIGVPYLWGGRTPGGMDCSGLVQLLMAERGVRLPRDAREQERVTRPLPPGERPRPGDLLFFGPRRAAAAHVGVLLAGDRFVHARGWVRLASVNPDNELYDLELGKQKRGVRRPHGRPRTGSSRPAGSGRHSC